MSSSIKELIAAQQAYNDLVSQWADSSIQVEAQPIRPYQDGDLKVGDVFTVEGSNTRFRVTSDGDGGIIATNVDALPVKTMPNQIVSQQWIIREAMKVLSNGLKVEKFDRSISDQNGISIRMVQQYDNLSEAQSNTRLDVLYGVAAIRPFSTESSLFTVSEVQDSDSWSDDAVDSLPILGAPRLYNADAAPAIITSKRRASRQRGEWMSGYYLAEMLKIPRSVLRTFQYDASRNSYLIAGDPADLMGRMSQVVMPPVTLGAPRAYFND